MMETWRGMDPARQDAMCDLGLLPRPEHSALMRALAHQDPERAKEGYSQWKQEVDFENDVDVTTFSLLPALFRRLRNLGVRDELYPRLEGIYKQALYRNHLLIHRALGFVERLKAHDIPVLVIKGFPLLELYYQDRGARAMGDVDILIPEDRGNEVQDLLMADGEWTTAAGQDWSMRHSLYNGENYRNAQGLAIDLHWHLLFEACFPGTDDSFWEASRSFEFRGSELHTLDHADAMLLAMVHGGRGRYSTESLVRWILDSTIIAEVAGEEFDWARLVDQARRLHQVPLIEGALRHLREGYETPVPSEVIEELAATKVSIWDLRFLEYQSHPPEEPWKQIQYYWSEFWMRLARERSFLSWLPLLTPFLCHRLGDWKAWKVYRYFFFLFRKAAWQALWGKR